MESIVETLDLYRKMRLWINEIPDDCRNVDESDVCIYKADRGIYWFNGTLCLELRIAPRDISNYAMLDFKFTQDDSGTFKIRYMFSKEDRIVASDIAVQTDTVHSSIVNEYHKVLIGMFDELSTQNIFPSGTLEILGGRYGDVGSSERAVITVARTLIDLFELGETFKEADIKAVVLEGCKRK